MNWTLTGDSDVACAAKNKSTKAFSDHLHLTMDHPVSQQCWIYQLEDACMMAGESFDELTECI